MGVGLNGMLPALVLLARADQTIVALDHDGASLRLFMDCGGPLVLETTKGATTPRISLSATPTLERHWYSVLFAYDAENGNASLSQRPFKPIAQVRDARQISGTLDPLARLAPTVILAGNR